MKFAHCLLVAGTLVAPFAIVSNVNASTVLTYVGADLTTGAYNITFEGATFTFAASGDPFNPLAIETSATGAVSSVLGAPSPFFTDVGTVTFDSTGNYSSIGTATTVDGSFGYNFLGLRVTNASQSYFGFAYTSDTTLVRYGFETDSGQAVIASVPEPSTWALMLVGVAVLGGALGLQRHRTTARFAV